MKIIRLNFRYILERTCNINIFYDYTPQNAKIASACSWLVGRQVGQPPVTARNKTEKAQMLRLSPHSLNQPAPSKPVVARNWAEKDQMSQQYSPGPNLYHQSLSLRASPRARQAQTQTGNILTPASTRYRLPRRWRSSQ